MKDVPEGAKLITYDQGKQRLTEYVRNLKEPWNPTPLSREINGLADRLESVLRELETPSASQFDIECEHDKPEQQPIGLDGLPIEMPDWRCSYQGTLLHMRELLASARRTAEGLPNPRKRYALERAATGVVWLFYEHRQQIPKLYEGGDGVRELAAICEAAGIAKSAGAYRGALSVAIKEFDHHMVPGWLVDLGVV